jgi:hypothetical protein
MTKPLVAFVAILLTALYLVPGGAHLFELPGKMRLGRDAYFATQQIYAGWAWFGIVLFAALAADVALVVTSRHERLPLVLALIGLGAMVANLAIFFAFTAPANAATGNWTSIPANWELLRTQWEYSHAVNALVTLAGLCAVTLAGLLSRR